MFGKLIFAAALSIAGASAGMAATSAVATANVNLRAGPSTAYPAVTIVPAGTTIATFGCVSGYSWCDVGVGPYRGWIAASYLQVLYRGTPVVLTAPVAPAIGLTVVTFDRAYWDTYYRASPWYARWAAYPPYVASPVTSAYRGVNCANGACTAVRGATGYYGGATSQIRSCAGGSCTATRTTVGPQGGYATRTRNCAAGRGCSATRSFHR